MKKVLSFLLFFILWHNVVSQYASHGTGDLLHRLEKLKVLGSALYVAAHPDDENTLLITWLANEKKVRTGYFSFTRGDGGQNLLGTEQGEFAGLLRTNELLAARTIDGGEQFFSRANDFGYCKTTEEALETWGKEQVLADLVYHIRKFRPDVIITRFPPDERAGHGHHSASSLLAEQAFQASANASAFPEQLKDVNIWQAKRLVWNSYNRGFRNTPPEDSSAHIQVDIGAYNSLLGASYGEIGALARSMHRSQGFGSALSRGKRIEILTHTKGEPAETDLFDGINTSWSRISGGSDIEKLMQKIIADFEPTKPSASVRALLQLSGMLDKLSDQEFIAHKKQELKKLILDFAGIYGEFVLNDYAYAPGDSLTGNLNVINRSDLEVEVSLLLNSMPVSLSPIQKNLKTNENIAIPIDIKLADNQPISQPYWLWEDFPIGYYHLADEHLRGTPMSPPALAIQATFNIDGQLIIKEFPATYKYVEPSFGEIYRPLEIRPEICVNANVGSLVFSGTEPQEIRITAKSSRKNLKAEIGLKLPDGWRCKPKLENIVLNNKFDETHVTFKIYPPLSASKTDIEIYARTDQKEFNRGIKSIRYSHIPEITIFPVTKVHAVKLDLKKEGERVGYIMGAGDEVPLALEQIGYQVTTLRETDLNNDLSDFDAILVGVRAYNTQDWLPQISEKLMQYVHNGGNLICQYQGNGGSESWVKKMAPYMLSLSRDRVSEEQAEVRFLSPESPILNTPNKLTKADFEGWVQERGLYFASKWDEHFESVLSMNDKNEKEQRGGLLHARYGSGHFVYTGLAFFRELPAGVPGAYRLLANLISL